MKLRMSMNSALVALTVAGAAITPAAANAQSAAQSAGGNTWQTSLALYAYLPTIGGSTTFPTLPGSPSPGVNIDGQTIIDNLKMTFMGTLGVHNGRWGAFTDVLYLNIGGNKAKTRDFSIDGAPSALTGDLSLDIKGSIWTLAGEYRLATSDPALTVDVLGGARMLSMTNTLGWNFSGAVGSHPLAGRSGSTELSNTWWDAIVGVKGHYAFGDRKQWFVPFYVDIGTGETKFTYQLLAGVGYRFGWGELSAAWRYIDYDMKSGSSVQSMNFNGPMIGATWRW